jgi:hypothetical protein
MPLSDDQKAMLRLLARDQSYEDIAALLGLSVDEVVERAQGAVAQLEAEGIPAPTLPAAGKAMAPDQPAPKAPEPPAPAAPPPPPPPPPPRPAAAKQPRDRNALLAIGAGLVGAIVIVVLLVLLISGSDGDGGDSGSTTTVSGNGDETTVAGGRKPTTAQLVAVDGSAAEGEATFGRVGESLGLGIDATGVEPAPQGSIYMVWLAQSPEKLLPLTAVAADKANRIKASYKVPTEAVVYLASGDFDQLVITLSDNKQLRSSLETANSEKEFPVYTGTPVLEGRVVGPIIGAAKRLEERQKERKEGE